MDGSSEQWSKICENPDISKAPADIYFEMKLALGRKNDCYLTGYRQQWIRGAFSRHGNKRNTARWERRLGRGQIVSGEVFWVGLMVVPEECGFPGSLRHQPPCRNPMCSPGHGLSCCPRFLTTVKLLVSLHSFTGEPQKARGNSRPHWNSHPGLQSRRTFVAGTPEHPAVCKTGQVPAPPDIMVTRVGFGVKDPSLDLKGAASWPHDFRQSTWPL